MALLALLVSTLGLALLALAMPRHWRQVLGERPSSARMLLALRLTGSLLLLGAFTLCLRRDHATMAVLAWFMDLSVGAVAIALGLAWRTNRTDRWATDPMESTSRTVQEGSNS